VQRRTAPGMGLDDPRRRPCGGDGFQLGNVFGAGAVKHGHAVARMQAQHSGKMPGLIRWKCHLPPGDGSVRNEETSDRLDSSAGSPVPRSLFAVRHQDQASPLRVAADFVHAQPAGSGHRLDFELPVGDDP